MPLNTIQEAIEQIRRGQFVIVVDDEGRENEGDLVIAAEKVTPEAINFMATHARGLICCALTPERLEQLGVPLMVSDSEDRDATAFTITVDAKDGVTTGISAFDRAKTIRALIDPKTQPGDLQRPGHSNPLRARPGGVLQRAGHTEASVDLARLAGLYPAGAICEIMKGDGTMARLPELQEFAAKHDICIISIASLIEHRLQCERQVERVAEARLPTLFGDFKVYAYHEKYNGAIHLAAVMGEIRPDIPTLARVQSECLTGDVFSSLRCDCRPQLEAALQQIARDGAGVFIYMRQHEGRGIGLHNKIKSYSLQDHGLDTVEANQALGFAPDLRRYGTGAQILLDLNVRKMRLMTNNPRKIVGLEGFGLELVERVPIEIQANKENLNYLRTKKEKLGHFFSIEMDGKE
ncbi:MAG: bifunctional 3,4-dihydroxy-2-butanone-4-phosphate synthase/GTP cyclohydrolase II [bacterium]